LRGKLSSYVFAVFDAEDNGCIKNRWGQGLPCPQRQYESQMLAMSFNLPY